MPSTRSRRRSSSARSRHHEQQYWHRRVLNRSSLPLLKKEAQPVHQIPFRRLPSGPRSANQLPGPTGRFCRRPDGRCVNTRLEFSGTHSSTGARPRTWLKIRDSISSPPSPQPKGERSVCPFTPGYLFVEIGGHWPQTQYRYCGYLPSARETCRHSYIFPVDMNSLVGIGAPPVPVNNDNRLLERLTMAMRITSC